METEYLTLRLVYLFIRVGFYLFIRIKKARQRLAISKALGLGNAGKVLGLVFELLHKISPKL